MNLNFLIWSPYGFATLDYKQKQKQKNEIKKNAIRRDHIWKQALRYNTTSLKF